MNRDKLGKFKKGHKPTYTKKGKEHIRYKHGLCRTPIYIKWYSIKSRCENKNNDSYKNYGGRGIRVCDRWQKFENFLEDMGNSFKEGMSIERIDNNGNYCKENCKWIPMIEQVRNKRNVVLYEYKGEKLTIPELEIKLGLTKNMLRKRIKVMGWSIKRAIETPTRTYKSKKP